LAQNLTLQPKIWPQIDLVLSGTGQEEVMLLGCEGNPGPVESNGLSW